MFSPSWCARDVCEHIFCDFIHETSSPCSNVFDFTNKFPMNLITNSFCHTNCPPKSKICVFFSRNPGTHAGKTGKDHENFREALRLTSQNTHPDFFARMLPLLQSDLQYKPSSRHVDIFPIIFLLHNIRTTTPASTGPFHDPPHQSHEPLTFPASKHAGLGSELYLNFSRQRNILLIGRLYPELHKNTALFVYPVYRVHSPMVWCWTYDVSSLRMIQCSALHTLLIAICNVHCDVLIAAGCSASSDASFSFMWHCVSPVRTLYRAPFCCKLSPRKELADTWICHDRI